MKKYTMVLLLLCTAVLFSGCDSLFAGRYVSVIPHEEYSNVQTQDSLEAAGTEDLVNILTQLTENGMESCVIYVTNLTPVQLEQEMKTVITEILDHTPIGAFAVEAIEYDIGTSTGRTAVAVKVLYNRSRSDILRIKKVANMDQALTEITDALKNCDPGVVVQVETYRKLDIVQKIQDFADANPDTCMELPQVSEALYPQSGSVRVIELTFSYQSSREALRQMQTYVQPVFRAAVLNASGEETESTKFFRTYTFLMERMDYQFETSITPAYSLLRHGVGDSKAFATVYAAMCKSAGLECHVISGTRSGEPWNWNLIYQDGVYYHLDLLQSNAAGEMILGYQNEMEGYVWDYSAFPESIAPEILEPVYSGSTEPPTEATEPQETQDPSEIPTEVTVETTLPVESEPETTQDG